MHVNNFSCSWATAPLLQWKEIPQSEQAMGLDFLILCPTFIFINHYRQQLSFFKTWDLMCHISETKMKVLVKLMLREDAMPGETTFSEAGLALSFHRCSE